MPRWLAAWVRWLTPDRVRVYPAMVAGMFAVGWVASQVLGEGPRDVGGTVIGADFVSFWAAGRLWWTDPTHVYELQKQMEVQESVGAVGRVTPFMHPPWAIALFAPFGAMPYPIALAAWWALSLGALAAAVEVARRGLGAGGSLGRGIAAAACFFPVPLALAYGQTSTLLLLVLAAGIASLRQGREIVGGFLLGLLAFKPQLALPWAVVLVAARRPAAVVGFVLAVSVEIAVGLLLDPAATLAWPGRAGEFASVLLDDTYRSWGQVGPLGFWQALLGGFARGAVLPLASATAVLLVLAAAASWATAAWAPGTVEWDRRMAATGIVAVLSAAHLFAYDLALGLVPIALLAGTRADLREGGAPRAWTALAWLAAFVGPYLVLAQLAITARLGLSEVALAVVLPVWLAWARAIARTPADDEVSWVGSGPGTRRPRGNP